MLYDNSRHVLYFLRVSSQNPIISDIIDGSRGTHVLKHLATFGEFGRKLSGNMDQTLYLYTEILKRKMDRACVSQRPERGKGNDCVLDCRVQNRPTMNGALKKAGYPQK